MKLLIKSTAGLLFLVFGLGIALVVWNFYLGHQELGRLYALPTPAGAVWLAHEVSLALVYLVATAGTFAKRGWGGLALAIALTTSTLNVLYRLLCVDTTLLVGRTPEAGVHSRAAGCLCHHCLLARPQKHRRVL